MKFQSSNSLNHIPFQEQDTTLSNETNPQCIIPCFVLTQYGQTALIRASLNGHANVVEKLLAARATHDHEDKVRNLATRVMLIHAPNAFVANEVLHLFPGQ